MPSKKTPSVFEIHFEGEQLYPEKIPVRTLSYALSAIQRLVAGSDSVDEEIAERKAEDDSLRLVEVKRGSAIYKVAGPAAVSTRVNLCAVGRMLEHPENVAANQDFMLSPIERLSEVAKRLSCTIILREPGKKKEFGAVLARIEPVSYEEISKTLLIKGDTSFSGKVVRVGGATAVRCGLRVPFRNRLLYCNVKNQRIARLIGQRLYQEVVVDGTAQWLKSSWHIFTFTINEIREQPKQGSIVEAMEALREAGGKAWDLVEDPKAYLEEIENEK